LPEWVEGRIEDLLPDSSFKEIYYSYAKLSSKFENYAKQKVLHQILLPNGPQNTLDKFLTVLYG
jgi:hypothetical protein